MLKSYWEVLECIFHVSFKNNIVSLCLNEKFEDFLRIKIFQLHSFVWDVIIDWISSKMRKKINTALFFLYLGISLSRELINREVFFWTSLTRFLARSLVNFSSMTVNFFLLLILCCPTIFKRRRNFNSSNLI